MDRSIALNASRRGLLAGAGALIASGCAGLAGRAEGPDDHLYYLNVMKVMRLDPLTGNRVTLVDQSPPEGVRFAGLNDGIAIDHRRGLIYWTDMGRPAEDDGRIQRCRLDGSEVTMIVPPGGAFTPKQMRLDLQHGKIWWSDREGMSIRRCNLDGSKIETVVATGDPKAQKGDEARWCVGLALDLGRGHVYWTQKGSDNSGKGTIHRAPMELRRGETAAKRSDIETLFSNMPEPIDLDLDLKSRTLYWGDRGDNTVSRAPMDGTGRGSKDREILVRGLDETIGVALDLKRGRMAYTTFGGQIGLSALDGGGARFLATGQKSITGISWGL